MDPAGIEFFERKIRPLLAEHCYECHSAQSKKVKGGLVLDNRPGLLKGGEGGPVIVPGEPEQSRLMEAVRYANKDFQMPPKRKLSAAQIGDLEAWIKMGAPDPRNDPAPAVAEKESAFDLAAARGFWAFQPPRGHPLPSPKSSAWVRSPIDHFVLAKLEEHQLTPAPLADRRTLIRRVTFGLTGLPPAPEEIEDFLADAAPDAFARVVDRLLDSPRYGERWGRHWLDLARYADSNGQDENKAIANAFRYRDYVIAAMNKDKPFDRFILEQLAGDLLPAATDAEAFENWTATGFLVLGPKMLAEQDKPKLVMDIVDEQIDVVSRVFLGLTISCARCHDHKYDPISARDYYALAGIFKSTKTMANLDFVSKWNERPLANAETLALVEAHPKKVEQNRLALEKEIKAANDALQASWRKDLARYLLAAAARRSAVSSTGQAGNAEPCLPAGAAPASLHPPDLNPVILERWQSHLSSTLEDGTSPFALWHALSYPQGSLARSEGAEVVSAYAKGPIENTATFVAAQFDASSAVSLQAAAEEYQRVFQEAEQKPREPLVRLGPGRLGSGLLCDGQVFFEAGHAPELEPAEFTLEAWIQAAEYPGKGDKRRWIVSKNANELANGHYALVLDGSQAGAYLNIGGGKENLHAVLGGAASLMTNRWHHLAATYDGRDLRLYVDGAEAGHTRVKKTRTAGDGPLVIGRRPDGFVNFEGHVDEVILHHRQLTAQEVRARFERPEHAAEPAAGRWSFDLLTPEQQAAWARSQLRTVLYGTNGLFALPPNARDFYQPEAKRRVVQLEEERDALKASAPRDPPVALCAAEDKVTDLPVHIRGSHLTLAKESVPRGFPEVLTADGSGALPSDQSGRLQLARWLVDAGNPLTSRVLVNRVWQWHFGDGLVRTPDNFGLRGEEPSHPELLDWIAHEFIRQGWSLKKLHRLMLLSSTYQMSARFDEGAAQVDPENRLLWRMNRRRLDAEEVRDALLFVGGHLDFKTGGSLVTTKNNEYVRFKEYEVNLRSVYLPVIRDRVYDVLTILDFANPSVTTSKRVPTVVAHQALFFMNSPLVLAQARGLYERLLASAEPDLAERIRAAYVRAVGRPPSPHEIERGLRFIREAEGLAGSDSKTGRSMRAWESFCQTLLASNEFLYVD